MVSISTDGILYSIIAGLFLILVGVFLFQSILYKRSVPFLLTSLSIGFIGALFATLRDIINFESSMLDSFFLSTQLSCYGLQIFFFLLFLLSLEHLRSNTFSLFLSLSLLLFQIFGLWSIVRFSGMSEVTGDMWLVADLGYTLNALLTYAVIGIPVYIRMWKNTQEKKSQIFAIALIVISSGYIYLTILDITHYFGATPEWFGNLSILGDLLPLLGLFTFMILYLTDINYIYRLPYDNFILVVALKYGPAIHALEFETKREIKLQKDLLSGLLTGVNQIFHKEFKSNEPFTLIESEDLNVILESGENITVFIITERPSRVLRRALRRYVKEFENKFGELIKHNATKVDNFDHAVDLVKPIFPFMRIKRKL